MGEKTIQQTIQNTLNSLERDCDHIGTLVDEAIAKDNKARASNFKAYVRGGFLYLAFLSLPLALLLTLVLGLAGEKLVRDMVGKQGAELITLYTAPVRTFWSGLPSDYQVWAAGGLILLTFVLLLLARWASRTSSTLSRRQKRSLLDKQEYVQNVVKAKKGLSTRSTCSRQCQTRTCRTSACVQHFSLCVFLRQQFNVI